MSTSSKPFSRAGAFVAAGLLFGPCLAQVVAAPKPRERRKRRTAFGVSVVVALASVVLAGGADSRPQAGSVASGAVPGSTVELVPKARTVQHRQLVRTFTFSPDSKLLAVSTADGAVFAWDVATGQATGPRFGGAKDPVDLYDMPAFRFRFSSDGKHLIRISSGSVTVWNCVTGEVVLSRDHLKAAAASPDAMTLALAKDGAIVLWDVRTLQVRDVQVKGDLGEFSPAGDRLAIAAADGLNLVPLSGGPVVAILSGEKKNKKEKSEWRFAADGSLLATASKGQISIWDVREGRQIGPSLDGGSPLWCRTCLEATFTAGNEVLAVRGEEVVKFWAVTSGRLVAETARLAFGRNTGGVWLLPSPKSQLLAISPAQVSGLFPPRRKTGPLELWDVGTRPPRVLESLAGAIPIAFSPDGETLVYKVTGGFSFGAVGGPLGLWNAKRGKSVAILDGKCPVRDNPYNELDAYPSFSPDGMWIACVGWPKPQDVSLWDISRFR